MRHSVRVRGNHGSSFLEGDWKRTVVALSIETGNVPELEPCFVLYRKQAVARDRRRTSFSKESGLEPLEASLNVRDQSSSVRWNHGSYRIAVDTLELRVNET